MSIKEQIQSILDAYAPPSLASGVIHAKTLKHVAVAADGSLAVTLQLPLPVATLQHTIAHALQTEIVRTVTEGKPVTVTIEQKIHAHAVKPGLQALKPVKNIIAIGSGKGGVGKSTVTVNFALALQAAGARVGVLDADIYGPSVPRMLGGKDKPESKDGRYLYPVLCHGIQTISIGYIINQDDTPLVWRGPMVTKALQQLVYDTLWDDLDYLLIDLPPGTGDIQLTLAQKIPVSGAAVVTTPQDVALLDVSKAIRMFAKVDIPVLGVVENMNIHRCTQCGHEESIFGTGGGRRIAAKYDVPYLGGLPLAREIQEQADCGMPTVLTDSPLAHMYRDIALNMVSQLALRPKDYSAKFPNIVVNAE